MIYIDSFGKVSASDQTFFHGSLTYNSSLSSIKTNGCQTTLVNLKWGLRQGSALYILTVETMAVSNSVNLRLHGIQGNLIKKTNFAGFPNKIVAQYMGNNDCKRQNQEA